MSEKEETTYGDECVLCQMTTQQLIEESCSPEEARMETMETLCSIGVEGSDNNVYKPVNVCGKCRKCNECGDPVNKEDCYTLCTCFGYIFCESCESDAELFWCTICQQHMHYDYMCRHIYYVADFEIQGSGSWSFWWYKKDRYHDKYLKPSFFELLDFMGLKFALDLRLTVSKNKVGFDFLHSSGSLFGATSIWMVTEDVYAMPNKHSFAHCYEHGEKMFEFNDYCEENDDGNGHLSDCYWWLVSLDKQKTEANKVTVDWVDEWLWQNKCNFFFMTMDMKSNLTMYWSRI